MTLQLMISYLLYVMGFVSISCFLLFSLMYWKRERDDKRRIAQTHEDIGDVNALFQTMRGIVEQQKQLAAAFNDDLDKKMQMVKQVLGQSLNRNEELYERQRLLTRELETVSLEIKSIQRQVGELDEMIQTGRSFERRKRLTLPNVHDIERIPENPVNPDKARSAFRTLLESQRNTEKEAPFPSADDLLEDGFSASDASLQRQVEAYHAAGMDVTEIAAKLNIGRGEVRLMLSLKDEQ
jgi:hypothetical protein